MINACFMLGKWKHMKCLSPFYVSTSRVTREASELTAPNVVLKCYKKYYQGSGARRREIKRKSFGKCLSFIYKLICGGWVWVSREFCICIQICRQTRRSSADANPTPWKRQYRDTIVKLSFVSQQSMLSVRQNMKHLWWHRSQPPVHKNTVAEVWYLRRLNYLPVSLCKRLDGERKIMSSGKLSSKWRFSLQSINLYSILSIS